VRRLRLILEYDGTRYCGFQRQPGQLTVQGELERRLSRICGHPIEVAGAGRTDTGVHALGQVIHFDTTGRIPVDRVALATNSYGGDLVVRHAEIAPLDFHARFSAVERTYHYFLTMQQPTPFAARYSTFAPGMRPDAQERMKEALAPLVGRRDFSTVAAAGSSGSRERTLLRTAVLRRGTMFRVELTADSFLRSMVRMLAGWLLEIGRGAREPHELAHAVFRRDPPGAVKIAAARGLFLMRVNYPDGFTDGTGAEGIADWWPGCV
jgi:tRNA pseudouridine38-40 synthase